MGAHRGKFVAYYRVSTDRQGQSGLGLEAQREAVLAWLNGGSWTLIAEFTEVESGKHADRPQLAAALAACKKQKARLVIAKLDRLSRNLAFLATLMTLALSLWLRTTRTPISSRSTSWRLWRSMSGKPSLRARRKLWPLPRPAA
jgi:hypothetical protein